MRDCFVNGVEMSAPYMAYNTTNQRVHVIHVIEQPGEPGI